jgi:hypothetical protein
MTGTVRPIGARLPRVRLSHQRRSAARVNPSY